MAKGFNSVRKDECIGNPMMRPRGGWKSALEVELAVHRTRALQHDPGALREPPPDPTTHASTGPARHGHPHATPLPGQDDSPYSVVSAPQPSTI